jgi:hypothetical protein
VSLSRKTPMKQSKIMPRPPYDWPREKPIAKVSIKPKKKPTTKARKSADGEHCTVRFQPCIDLVVERGVVLCHLSIAGSAGKGIKALDREAVFGCKVCHDIIDGRDMKGRNAIPDGEFYFALLRAVFETQKILVAKGVTL